MQPGDWVSTTYEDEDGDVTALVIATSTHKAVIHRADVDRLIAEAGRVYLRDVQWRSVLVSDWDDIGDDCEFHENGTGRRWAEVALCSEDSHGDAANGDSE